MNRPSSDHCTTFKGSANSIAFIDCENDEQTNSSSDRALNNEPTDQNNNGDNKYLRTNSQGGSSRPSSRVIRWEDEVRATSSSNTGSDNNLTVHTSGPTLTKEPDTADHSTMKTSDFDSPTQRPLGTEFFQHNPHKAQVSFSPSLQPESSANESSTRFETTTSRFMQSELDSDEERFYQNMNGNNNKKKKEALLEQEEQCSGGEYSGRSANKSTTMRSNHSLDPHRKSRFRSVQLSSIRSFPSNRHTKLRRWIGKKNSKYGRRLVEKDGSSNVEIAGCEKMDFYHRYFNDIFTTMLDSSWSFVLFTTTIVYIGHWIIFGVFYWLFAIQHSDYARIKESSANVTDPCVYNVYDLTTAFLFSLESETTIGYGFRTITTTCPHAVVCLTLQCLVSAVFDTWVIGMCFARLARPDARTLTTMFSKNAVICRRDGRKCLLVRFANLRKSLLLNVTVRARLISTRRIKSETFNSPDKISYFELVFIITGTLESTGLTMHAQTSYLSTEILYGHRFVPVVSKSYEKQKYVVDFSRFDNTVPEMPANIKLHPQLRTSHPRSVSAPLIEETEEEEVLSTNDDVFTSGYEATITSVL